jgi:hypothetical protein
MPKGLPASYKEWFKDNATAKEALTRQHLRDQLGRVVACPTGDSATCPTCQALAILDSERVAAVDYLDGKNFNTSKVEGVTRTVQLGFDPDQPEAPGKPSARKNGKEPDPGAEIKQPPETITADKG